MNETSPAPTSPLAIASVVLAIVGVIAYCCGSFLCLGWIGPILWLIGTILGGVAMSQGLEGTSKTVAIVGLAMNIGFGLLFTLLLVFGVSVGVLGALLDQANR